MRLFCFFLLTPEAAVAPSSESCGIWGGAGSVDGACASLERPGLVCRFPSVAVGELAGLTAGMLAVEDVCWLGTLDEPLGPKALALDFDGMLARW